MENPISFDLNCAIQSWRGNLAASPSFRGENLDELEVHLRDSIATLQGRGLSAREAFQIATQRIGTGSALESEFAKVNQSAVWFDRCLWILIAFQVWRIISGASVFAMVAASVLAMTVNGLLPGLGLRQFSESSIQVTAGLLGSPLTIAIVLAMAWRFCVRPREKLRSILRRLLLRPWALTLVLFSCGVMFAAGYGWALPHWVYPILYHQSLNFPYPALRMFALRLPEFMILALLTLLVARKRLRTSKA
jgi:hypothetical protein